MLTACVISLNLIAMFLMFSTNRVLAFVSTVYLLLSSSVIIVSAILKAAYF